ncbi:MAG: hypothetical protein HON51_04910 [Gammaproteobacteria bacterium]|nr:hypothetical protein [Gammaproteobacteria bacterium]MBT6575565.1 hypothetical protein [Gammaproteobacteria bacterium]
MPKTKSSYRRFSPLIQLIDFFKPREFKQLMQHPVIYLYQPSLFGKTLPMEFCNLTLFLDDD